MLFEYFLYLTRFSIIKTFQIKESFFFGKGTVALDTSALFLFVSQEFDTHFRQS